nr:MAG TPA: hypothetical protein [Caudoviricetes sp.]
MPVFPRYLSKSEERGKFRCGEVSGDWLKRTLQWRFFSENSFWGSAITSI